VPLIDLGYKQRLREADLDDLPDDYKVEHNQRLIEANWVKYKD
jgi:hypothetical protein